MDWPTEETCFNSHIMQSVPKCSWGQPASSTTGVGFLPWVLRAKCEVTTYFSEEEKLNKRGAVSTTHLNQNLRSKMLFQAVAHLHL